MLALNDQLMVTIATTRFEAASRRLAISGKRERDDILKFIPPMCTAICGAHNIWRQQAFFRDISIMAVTAIGAPGTLTGPALKPLIRLQVPPLRVPPPPLPPWAPKHSLAIAAAVGEAWTEFQGMVLVPGLPWYPSFAAFPGAAAPPMPNVPWSLGSCALNRSAIVATSLKQRFARKFGHHDSMRAQLFESIAVAFERVVNQWLAAQMITNVLGHGQVPSFAPPYVPVGPVVNGQITPAPPHLGA